MEGLVDTGLLAARWAGAGDILKWRRRNKHATEDVRTHTRTCTQAQAKAEAKAPRRRKERQRRSEMSRLPKLYAATEAQ